MNTGATHPFVEDYLERLGSESSRMLPPDQARELVDDVREHLASALTADSSEAEIRDVLDRLGAPSEVVGAAMPPGVVPAAPPAPAMAPPRAVSFGGVEVGAIATLVLAEVLSVVWPLSIPLWIAGLVLLLVSRLWTGGEKALGIAGLVTGFPIVLFTLTYAVVGGASPAEVCSTSTSAGSGGQESSTTTCTPQSTSGTEGPVVWVLVVMALYALLQLYTIWRLVRARRRVA